MEVSKVHILHPTLDVLDYHTKVHALENGLLTLPEINTLLGPMKSPKVCVFVL